MFRKFRILILLVILATVGLASWRAQSKLSAWEHSIHVAIYPIAADDSAGTRDFIDAFKADHVEEIATWMQEESKRYGKNVLQPVVLRVAPRLSERPPLPPEGGGSLDIALWSLKLRWWAWQHDKIGGPKPDIRLFVLFHDPLLTPAPPHSTGLSKGGIGIIHGFAQRKALRQNNIVIAHEMLHIFGASDKYDLASNQPHWPQGYAEPERQPRFPQSFAEIMAGRLPIDEQHAEMPAGLAFTLIGPDTAREIGLLRRDRNAP